MGENSRNIGELGEAIVKEIFNNILHWGGINNIEVVCGKKGEHKKNTHGIDAFTVYKCPLQFGIQQFVYTSIKNIKDYPNPAKLLNHAKDIVEASKCFRLSERWRKQRDTGLATRHAHVLFMLKHSGADDEPLSAKLSVNELKDKDEVLYIVDNSKLNFLTNAFNFAKTLYPQETHQITFGYPETGVSNGEGCGRQDSGSLIPIQFLTSPILPFRISSDIGDYKVLYLAVKDEFSQDSLIRILALAQSMTSGWCNKIVIGFPDYREGEHAQEKDGAFMRFNQESFTKMVDVKCYKNSFRNAEAKNVVEYNQKPNPSMEEPAFNIETMLPFGDKLRQLLVQSKIQKTELISILNGRGVYPTLNWGKEELIPLLTTSLLSPNEFEFIRAKHQAKASADKLTTAEFTVCRQELPKQLEVLEQAASAIDVDTIIKKNHEDNKVVANSGIMRNADNNGLEMEIKFKRPKYTADWAEVNPTESVKILILPSLQQGTGKLNVVTIFNSADSKSVGKETVNNLVAELKKLDVMRRDEGVKRILASDYTNDMRTRIFMEFLKIDVSDNHVKLKFNEMVGCIYQPLDDAIPAGMDPSKVKKARVKQSILKGEYLEEMQYIKDDNLKIEAFCVKYAFECEGQKGIVNIDFGFPDLTKKTEQESKIEFEFKLFEFNFEKSKTLPIQTIIHQKLQLKFNDIKCEIFNSIGKKYGDQMSLSF